jgi:hypothetical protein
VTPVDARFILVARARRAVDGLVACLAGPATESTRDAAAAVVKEFAAVAAELASIVEGVGR